MRRPQEQGSIILVYSVAVGLLIIGGSVSAMALNEFRIAQRTANLTQSFYLAEAGLDRALVELQSDPDYIGTNYVPVYDAENNEIGGYEVTVSDVGNDQRSVSIVGHFPSDDTETPWYVANTIQANVTVDESSPFTSAVFANQNATFSGNAVVDSYNSNNGVYGGGNVGTNGDIGTNGTSSGAVTLSGNVAIQGDVSVGPGADVNQAVSMSGNVTVSGSIEAADDPQVLDPVEVPGGLTNLGDLSLSGQTTMTLAGGTYYYDDISISGQASLNFTGAATIYVSGSVSISGQGIGTAGNTPANLIIYVENNDGVSFSGLGNFYGAVYAPESAISVSGNGVYYGALVSNTFTDSGNGGVHYDEALDELGGGGGTVELNLWQLNPSSSPGG